MFMDKESQMELLQDFGLENESSTESLNSPSPNMMQIQSQINPPKSLFSGHRNSVEDNKLKLSQISANSLSPPKRYTPKTILKEVSKYSGDSIRSITINQSPMESPSVRFKEDQTNSENKSETSTIQKGKIIVT